MGAHGRARRMPRCDGKPRGWAVCRGRALGDRRPLRRQGAELGCPIRSAREVAALLTAQPVANRKEKKPGWPPGLRLEDFLAAESRNWIVHWPDCGSNLAFTLIVS